jgi:formamidopyrimidine-DNA glycosylase
MPELPEVEHVVRALRVAVLGRQIVAADLRLKRTAPGISKGTFDRKLRGARITSLGRRGKHILIHLNTDLTLLIHLRMTGKFVYLNSEEALPPYSHVVFYLDNEHRLVYCDMRQFGRMSILKNPWLLTSAPLHVLAPEPLSEDFSVDYLRNVTSRSRRQIKQLLLDQTKVLGLGNIYAAEALFLAGISPFAVSQSLSRKRLTRLHGAIQQILTEAIESGSTLQIDLADGLAGYFGNVERFWRVYEREGEPCVKCGTKIKRIVQAGRSTYYCPRCQRK